MIDRIGYAEQARFDGDVTCIFLEVFEDISWMLEYMTVGRVLLDELTINIGRKFLIGPASGHGSFKNIVGP